MEGRDAKKVGVLLVQHGEPETYKYSQWLQEFKKMFGEFKNTSVPVPPKIMWPILAWVMKSHYKGAGGRSTHVAVSKKQWELLKKEIPECEVYMGFMEMIEPSIATTAHQMIKDGIAKIIAIPVMLTDSSHTEEIKEILEEVEKEQRGVEVILTRPIFYKADPLASMCAQLILNQVDDTPIERVGVLLASHGEPDEWVRLKIINTRCNEQETAFRKMIRKKLVTLGFKDENITDAFNEFVEPKITPAVEKIARKVDKIIVLPAFGQTEGLHHIYDIPTKAKKAKIPPKTTVTCIKSWAHEPILIKALVDLYRDALRGEVYQSPQL
jgi:protoheme ferro-lyase